MPPMHKATVLHLQGDFVPHTLTEAVLLNLNGLTNSSLRSPDATLFEKILDPLLRTPTETLFR